MSPAAEADELKFQPAPSGSRPFTYSPCSATKCRWRAYRTVEGSSWPCAFLGKAAKVGFNFSVRAESRALLAKLSICSTASLEMLCLLFAVVAARKSEASTTAKHATTEANRSIETIAALWLIRMMSLTHDECPRGLFAGVQHEPKHRDHCSFVVDTNDVFNTRRMPKGLVCGS